MGLEELRARNKDGKLDKFIKAAEKTQMGKKRNDFQDPDLFYPNLDSDGNAHAKIRFLPGLESEEEPIYVEQITHGFKGVGGKFFYEYCPTAVEKPCPICDANRKIVDDNGGDFDALSEVPQKLVRNRSRKITYYANVLVIENPSDPSVNGKVMKFRFGKKILEKIMAKVNPQFETDPPVLVWEYLEGSDFKLVIKKVKGFANYDDSSFEAVRPLDDATISMCRDKQFPLAQYTDPKLYKDYNVIRNRLSGAIGSANLAPLPDDIGGTFDPQTATPQKSDPPSKGKATNPLTEDTPSQTTTVENPQTGAPLTDVSENPTETDADNGMGDDDMDYFMNLAGGEGGD